MKLPSQVKPLCENIEDIPEWLFEVIEECDNDYELNEFIISDEPLLCRAEINIPNGTGKDIVRVFRDQAGNEIKLSNFEYSLIEKWNRLKYYKGKDFEALVIFDKNSVEGLILKNKKEEK